MSEDFTITLKCAFCSSDYTIDKPEDYSRRNCPQCRRNALMPVSPYHDKQGRWDVDKFSGYIRNKYQMITLNPTNEIYFYDSKDGIWKLHGELIVRQRLATDMKSLNKKNYFNEAINHLQGLTMVQDNPFDVNADIPFLNGVLNLNTMQLMEFKPEFYLTKKLAVRFNPKAIPNKVLSFLYDISDGSFETFIMLLEGMAYTFFVNSYPIQAIFVLHGEGSNGKSKFLNLLTRLVDADKEHKNSSNLTFEQICMKQFASAKLKGKLLNVSADIPARPIGDIAMLKEASGGDRIDADVKFSQDGVNFTNVAKLWFSANTLPRITEDTRAVYRRLQVIEFTRIFDSDKDILPEITTNEELEGLANLLVRIFYPVIKQNGKLTFAKDYSANRKLYIRASDSVKDFVEHNVVLDEFCDVPKADIYKAYTSYCETSKIPFLEVNAFWRRMGETLTNIRHHRKNNEQYVGGIKVQVNPFGEEEAQEIIEPESKSFSEQFDDYLKVNEKAILTSNNNLDCKDIKDIKVFLSLYIINDIILSKKLTEKNPDNPDNPAVKEMNAIESKSKEPETKEVNHISKSDLAKSIIRLLSAMPKGIGIIVHDEVPYGRLVKNLQTLNLITSTDEISKAVAILNNEGLTFERNHSLFITDLGRAELNS